MSGVMMISSGGMTADQNAMKNNAANLANSNTLGYMEANSNFVTQVSGGTSGVSLYTSNQFEQPGPVQSTIRELDFATNGPGFIAVRGPTGLAFKKTASCSLDKTGVLLDEAGNKMLGMPNTAAVGAPPVFAPPTEGALMPVAINMAGNMAAPTTEMTVNSTLPSQFVPPAVAFAPCVLQMQIYDSLGGAHMIDLTLTHNPAPPGGLQTIGWTLNIAAAAGDPTGVGTVNYPAQILGFNNAGTLIAPLVVPNIQFQWTGNGSARTNIALDVSKMTVMGPTFSTGLPRQNGSGMGTFVGVDVGKDGGVSEVYSNGMKKLVYKVPLAKFAATNQMKRSSGNLLLSTNDSGPPLFSDAGTPGVGDFLNKSLVFSATDSMANQVQMIELSQANTANAGAFSLGKEAGDTTASLMRG